jgi:hypothetical protein
MLTFKTSKEWQELEGCSKKIGSFELSSISGRPAYICVGRTSEKKMIKIPKMVKGSYTLKKKLYRKVFIKGDRAIVSIKKL